MKSVLEMKNKNSKRAVSPLVATVLLVAIAMAGSVLVYNWGKSFIGEHVMKFKEPIETVCQRVKFDASIEQKPSPPALPGTYELVFNNQGNENIKEVSLKAYDGGNSVTTPVAPETAIGGATMIGRGKTEIFNIDRETTFKGLSKIDRIEITPLLLGKGSSSGKTKLSPCKDLMQTLTL